MASRPTVRDPPSFTHSLALCTGTREGPTPHGHEGLWALQPPDRPLLGGLSLSCRAEGTASGGVEGLGTGTSLGGPTTCGRDGVSLSGPPFGSAEGEDRDQRPGGGGAQVLVSMSWPQAPGDAGLRQAALGRCASPTRTGAGRRRAGRGRGGAQRREGRLMARDPDPEACAVLGRGLGGGLSMALLGQLGTWRGQPPS